MQASEAMDVPTDAAADGLDAWDALPEPPEDADESDGALDTTAMGDISDVREADAEQDAPDAAGGLDTLDEADGSDGLVMGRNACGGESALIHEGVLAIPGDACGCGGVLACNGSDTMVCLGDRGLNACGGCAELGVRIGEGCGGCEGDVWTCEGADGAVCTGSVDELNLCGGCTELPAVPLELCDDAEDGAGLWVCSGPDEILCLGAGRNACGGLTVLADTVGAPCGRCGAGRFVCNGRDAVVCRGDGSAGNGCGGCSPLPGDIGSPCGTCGGTWECDPGSTERAQCSRSRNACGGCGALVGGDGPGDLCDGGSTYCATPTSLECGASEVNACGGRSTLSERVGDPCGECGDGIQVCAGVDRVVCVDASARNVCGGCGPLAAAPGSPCGTNRIWVCGEGGSLGCDVQRATVLVDSFTGGAVELGPLRLEVPPGAVNELTSITVSRRGIGALDGYTLLSPVFEFQPSGLEFERPVRVIFDTSGFEAIREPFIFWSRAGAPGYRALATTSDGVTLSADVNHFSSGFAGYVTELLEDERCDNLLDDNEDGFADCEDPSCSESPDCTCSGAPGDPNCETENQCPVAVVSCTVSGSGLEPTNALTATTLSGVSCSAAGTRDPDGGVSSYAWTLTGPTGSTTTLVRDEASSSWFVDVAGTYTVSLSVTDNAGLESCVPATATVQAEHDADVAIELLRVPAGTTRLDYDLHLLQPYRACWNNVPWDVGWRNRSPNWGDTESAEDDPRLALQSTNGSGPELIVFDAPEATLYRVGVHLFNDHGNAPANVSARIYIRGELALESSASLPATDAFWEVADIDWATDTVTRIDAQYDRIDDATCP